jgi:hypothetical protein
VVFDNAEDPRALTPLLPHGPGRVLITSRNPNWQAVATPIGVHEFTRGESVALLRTAAPELSGSEADRVAAAVGDLPLAVEQAGSPVHDARLGVEAYLRLLHERAGELLAHDAGGVYPVSVAEPVLLVAVPAIVSVLLLWPGLIHEGLLPLMVWGSSRTTRSAVPLHER